MNWYLFWIVVYIVGAFVTYGKVKSWSNPTIDKIFAVAFWPLTAVLYGIHWIHNKL